MSLTNNVYFVNGSMEGKCIDIPRSFTRYLVAIPPYINRSIEATLIIHKDGSEEWYDVIQDTPLRVDKEGYLIHNNFSYGDNNIRIGEIEDSLDNSLSVHEITLKLFKLFPELRVNNINSFPQSLYDYVAENNRTIHSELTEERLRGVIEDLYYREAPNSNASQYPFTNVVRDPDFRRLYNDNIDLTQNDRTNNSNNS